MKEKRKMIIPIKFIITGKKRKDNDNRELEVFLYTKNKNKQLLTLSFLKDYLNLELKK